MDELLLSCKHRLWAGSLEKYGAGVLVSWEDGSSRCKWLEESVSSPAGKFLVRLEEGAVCVEVAFRCCSAELQQGRSEAVGRGSLEHHSGRG